MQEKESKVEKAFDTGRRGNLLRSPFSFLKRRLRRRTMGTAAEILPHTGVPTLLVEDSITS